MTNKVSIIIPTLNEATCLERTLRCLNVLSPNAWEILVVDGGSEDETLEIAKAANISVGAKHSGRKSLTMSHKLSARMLRPYKIGMLPAKVRVLNCEKRGRSIQMNHGAKNATGDILCFVHADTWFQDDLITVIQETLADKKVACGGFISLMVGRKTTRWGISLHNYLKTYYAPLFFKPHLFFRGLRLLFGDQVMFCRRNDFWECGGFDENLPIMEDGDLCLKLVQKGQIRLVNRIVQSSDRRVVRWGSLKATTIYLYIGFLWGFGVSSSYLKQFYEEIR
ncbi:glycosyltransferase [Argonema galeatum]|uniref:glycosyltransferase n=1 Tax=Argonema galeatum TaxID=2942762 RepID=UPI0020138DB0|nr:glycosyltransferase [Argonema galeatum]MCL1467656.1 glycosyltransferase [Argonema galeatum A003/A1]